MSAPAFTPGPWHAQDLKQKHPRFGVITAKNVIVARSWIEPDAKLIASAPELYHSAYAFLEAYCEGGDDEAMAPFVIELGRSLRKARGEQ